MLKMTRIMAESKMRLVDVQARASARKRLVVCPRLSVKEISMGQRPHFAPLYGVRVFSQLRVVNQLSTYPPP